MKRWTHEVSQDWRTDTDDPEINAFRQLMADNREYQDDPYVGIFWYDTNRQELFGIKSALAEDLPFKYCSLFPHKAKTCTPLHEKVWQKEFYRKKDPRFSGDYTKVPRGRIFEVEDQGFVVCVGQWIKDHPEAKEEILYEFNLPEDTEFKIDEHWDLGHGWS